MLAQEKVTKEKGPLTFAVAGLLSGDSARALRRFADGTSLCRSERGAIHRAAPTGFFLHALAAAEREPGKSQSAAVLAAEARARSENRRNQSVRLSR